MKTKKTVHRVFLHRADGRLFYLFYISYFVFSVFPLLYCLVVSTSAVDCLERLISKMTYYVSSGTLNLAHSLPNSHFGRKLCCWNLGERRNRMENVKNPWKLKYLHNICPC